MSLACVVCVYIYVVGTLSSIRVVSINRRISCMRWGGSLSVMAKYPLRCGIIY
jgi:hypothetical protein